MFLLKRIKRYQSNFFMIGIWNLLFQFSQNITWDWRIYNSWVNVVMMQMLEITSSITEVVQYYTSFPATSLSERDSCFSSICGSFWAYLLLRITTISSFILGLQRWRWIHFRYSRMCRWCTSWWRRPQFRILAWITQWWQGCWSN